MEHSTTYTGKVHAGQRVKVRNRQASFEQMVVYALLIFVAVIMVLPLLWAIAASFTPNEKVFRYAYPFSWRAFLPVDFTLDAYRNLFPRAASAHP